MGFAASKGVEPRRRAGTEALAFCDELPTKRRELMPYILGWFMGVPLIVLIILYLIFH
jgi:hypothetical protein